MLRQIQGQLHINTMEFNYKIHLGPSKSCACTWSNAILKWKRTRKMLIKLHW